jgi:g-D-glutamyl-meso-diaminopimelate peptidase
VRKIKYFLILFIFFIIVSPIDRVSASFSDVPSNSWYYSDVKALVDKGIIKGYQNGQFGPNDSIIRQNVVRILGRWLIEENYYIPEDANKVKRFYDIPLTTDQELLQLSALLAEEGVFNGANGQLAGNASMTREQMALVLVRTVKTILNVDLVKEATSANYQAPIVDIKNLTKESQEAINAIAYAGLTKNTSYLPKQSLTRAEFATFVNRMMQYAEKIKLENALLNEELVIGEQESVEESEVTSEATPQVTPQEHATPTPDSVENPEESDKQFTHFTLKKGTTLYSSRNLKREIATLQQEQTFVYKPLEQSNLLYFEVGLERYYVDSKDAILSNQSEQSTSLTDSIGYIRLKGPFTLYADEALTMPIIIGNYDARFEVQKLQNNRAVINMNGKNVYVSFNDRVLFTNLPYSVLKDEALLRTDLSNKAIGTLSQKNTFILQSVSGDKVRWQDKFAKYAISKNNVIEVDELQKHPSISNQHAIQVTVKQKQDLYALNGTKVGSINAGEKLTIVSTNGETGYTYIANIPVKLPLTSIYHTNLVDSSKMITYETMVKNLKTIHTLYPSFTKLEVIGKTVEGKEIYALKVGNGPREIFMDASLHAREYMTTNVLMEMIDEYTHAYTRNTVFDGYQVKSVLDQTSIWFVPMVNIDGVTLVQKGVNATSYKDSVIRINGSSNVARWKANIRGVDLNRNFDGNWAPAATEKAPAWRNFKGYSVFSEPESRAIRDFVAKHKFQAYISYHSSGNLLYYWNWQSSANELRDLAFAKTIGRKTGYSVMSPLYKVGSGSSTDWFIRTYKKPGITMEISPYVGDQPVPFKNWADVWNRNKSIGLLSATESKKF